jgi:glycine/D-amino acid oxidase-like deaminating enzyme
MTEDDAMPEDFSFQLWNDDLDRIEDIVTDAMERVPLMATSGVGRVINGPIPYAPDGLPLIGPMPGVKNAFEAHTFTFGIAQGGGAGKVLAEWIVDGGTCGLSIRAATPITPIRTTATRKVWKFMATNTPCTSLITNGLPHATRNCRRCMTRSKRWAA